MVISVAAVAVSELAVDVNESIPPAV